MKAFTRWRLLRRRLTLPCLLVVILSISLSVSIFLITLESRGIHRRTSGNPTKLKEPRKIVILSYMRSGSTLTADLIQKHPGVFYVFEPLYSVEKIIRGFIAALYLNKPSHLLREEYTPKIDTLKSFLSCSLRDVDLLTLHQQHMDKSQTTRTYSKCTRNTSVNDFETTCLQPLMGKCRESEYSLVKTIRTKMESMEEILHLNQDLKVILLIRDPRATLFSRARLFVSGLAKTEAIKYHVKQAQTHCTLVQRDVRDAYRLAKLYPGRVAIFLYEKFVQNPIPMTEILYKFLGLNFTSQIASYVHNITGAGLPDNCPVCTTRKNSTETANKWRLGLGFEHVLNIDEKCLALYYELGYVTFRESTDLFNLNMPAWIEKPVTTMLTDRESYVRNNDIW